MQIISYPRPNQYKVRQSKVRYKKYKIPDRYKREALSLIDYWKQHSSTFHYAGSDVCITAMEYFTNIVTKWDEKSQELNGYKSCYLTISIAKQVLHPLKQKYAFKSKSIQFVIADHIFHQLEVEMNHKCWAVHNVVFALFLACEKYGKNDDWYKLRYIVEIIAMTQVMFHIDRYESRGGRTYTFPWESIDDPVIQYRKDYETTRRNKIKELNELKSNAKQPTIKNFWSYRGKGKRKNKHTNRDKIVNTKEEYLNFVLTELKGERKYRELRLLGYTEMAEDEEARDILEELDNGSDFDDADVIQKKENDENDEEKENSGLWEDKSDHEVKASAQHPPKLPVPSNMKACDRCTFHNALHAIKCEMCQEKFQDLVDFVFDNDENDDCDQDERDALEELDNGSDVTQKKENDENDEEKENSGLWEDKSDHEVKASAQHPPKLPVPSNMKACDRCTFHNALHAIKCEMCQEKFQDLVDFVFDNDENDDSQYYNMNKNKRNGCDMDDDELSSPDIVILNDDESSSPDIVIMSPVKKKKKE